jgi:AraC-like DNA-binding protein
MCRERRAQWKARLHMHRRAGRITALHEDIGLAMLRRHGQDGRLDPSHDTIADDAAASPRTVRRALERMAGCGLVMWARRLVRVGSCVEQASNAYVLTLSEVPHGKPTDGQRVRQTLKQESYPLSSVQKREREMTDQEMRISAARQLLAMGALIPATWGLSAQDCS